MILYWILRPLLYLYMLIFFPRRVYGKNKLPKGKHIVVCNHYSMMDVFFVGALYGKRITFLAKKELFENKVLGWFLRILGGIPVDREKVDFSTIKTVLKTLEKGEVIAIFPEGTRNRTDAELLPLKAGAGLFAVKGKVPVVPVMISKKCKIFRRTDIFVGESIDLSEYYSVKFTSELNEEISEKIRAAMLSTKNELKSITAVKRRQKEVEKG